MLGGRGGGQGAAVPAILPQAAVLQVLRDAPPPKGASPNSLWVGERNWRAEVMLGGLQGLICFPLAFWVLDDAPKRTPWGAAPTS